MLTRTSFSGGNMDTLEDFIENIRNSVKDIEDQVSRLKSTRKEILDLINT
jgi:hypothetical protein